MLEKTQIDSEYSSVFSSLPEDGDLSWRHSINLLIEELLMDPSLSQIGFSSKPIYFFMNFRGIFL